MKQNTPKQAVLASAIILATGYMGTAAAHTLTGTVAAGKVDIVNFQCFTDTDGSTGVPSTLAAQQVYIDVTSGTVTAAVGHIDLVSPANQDWTGQASTTGAGVTLTPPAGKTPGIWSSKGYALSVTNSTGSSQNYNVTFHCQRSNGDETGTGALITSVTTDPSVDYTVVIDN